MQFQNIIGQESAKSLLRKMADSERIPHALLFMGAPGSGDLLLAYAFAQYVLCEARSSGESCGRCSSCLKAGRLIHPDLHSSYPVAGASVTSEAHLDDWRQAIAANPYHNANQWLQRIGSENKQGNINKDECVNIIRKLSLKTFESRYKILVMWLPEYLGREGNRLLKLIEEPPDDTLFVLVAQNAELILPTIISRCQLIKVNALPDEEVEAALISRAGLTPEKARALAQLADGDYNEALKIAQQPENDHTALFLDWMRKCYQGNGVDMMAWVENFAALGRESQKHFLQYALHFMREYMKLKIVNHHQPRLLPAELTAANNLTRLISFGQVDSMVRLFTDCAYFVERNANQKLLFLDASIQLSNIFKTKSAA